MEKDCGSTICTVIEILQENCVIYYGEDCTFPCKPFLKCKTKDVDELSYCANVFCTEKTTILPITTVQPPKPIGSSVVIVLSIFISI